MFKTISLLLILIFPIISISQTIEYAKSLGSTGQDIGYAITTDNEGNVYTTGYFTGTVDFDPNDAEENKTAIVSSDAFILKLDPTGNFLWVKTMGGSQFESGYGIVVDDLGNIYTTGGFRSTVDFDPNDGVFELTAVGADDIFIQKLDADGNFLWAKAMGGTGTEDGHAVRVDSDYNIIIIGDFQNTVDFDPNAGVLEIASAGSSDVFLLKLDADGSLVWAHTFGSPTIDEGNGVALDTDDNIYFTGGYTGTVDFDPSEDVVFYLENDLSTLDAFLIKLNSAGEFVWGKGFGSSGTDQGVGIEVSNAGKVYVSGGFKSTVDFDPSSSGVVELASNGDTDVFLSKFGAGGNFIWVKTFGGTAEDIVAFTMGTDNADHAYVLWSTNLGGELSISIANTNADGTSAWLTEIEQIRFGFSLAVDNLGGVYTTGGFLGTIALTTTSGAIDIVSNGSYDAYIIKINPFDVGIQNESDLLEVAVYPNPNNGLFTIELSENQKTGTVQIFDFSGKLVYENTLNENQTTINLSSFSKGIYQAVFIVDSGKTISRKISIH